MGVEAAKPPVREFYLGRGNFLLLNLQGGENMMIKRNTTHQNVQVSKNLARCSLCGKPVMGMSKIGSTYVPELQAELIGNICPECRVKYGKTKTDSKSRKHLG